MRRAVSCQPTPDGDIVFSYYYADQLPKQTQTLANYSTIALAAIMGTASRHALGVAAIATGADVPVLSPSWAPTPRAIYLRDAPANILGSLVMGSLIGGQEYLLPRFPALYVGLTTGFCGSLTTFSSWSNSAAVLFARGAPALGVACMLSGLFATLSAVIIGHRVGSQLLKWCRGEPGDDRMSLAHPEAPAPTRQITAYPRYHSYQLHWIAACAVVLVGASAAALAASLASGDVSSAMLPLALLLAPLGATLRYFLASYNRRCPSFPAFTLACNAIGTAITSSGAAMAGVATPTSRLLISSSALGFAGSLSTVSTFVNECRLLPAPKAAVYAASTLAVGNLVALVAFRAIWQG